MKKVMVLMLACIFSLSCNDEINPTEINNRAPGIPGNPNPADGATGISTSPTLSWTCSDPDGGDRITYKIYFDTINPPNTFMGENLIYPNAVFSDLELQRSYYWRITATDTKGAFSDGPIWRFTTASSPSNQDLVAYYPFNGNANDESGNGNNGTTFGASLTGDRFDSSARAYSFNGIDQHIQAFIPDFPTRRHSRSISVWAITDSNYPDSLVVTITNYGGGCETPGDACDINIFRDPFPPESTEGICFDYDRGYVGTNLFFNNEWKHVVATYDSSSARMIVYVNGIKIAERIRSIYTQSCISGLYLSVGSQYGTKRFFKGKIDDIRIYDRAITEGEVLALYHEGGW